MAHKPKTTNQKRKAAKASEPCRCCLQELIDELCPGDPEGGPWWVGYLHDWVQNCCKQPKGR